MVDYANIRRQSAATPVKTAHRTGYVPIVIGASVMVTEPDGRRRQHEVHDLVGVRGEMARENRELQTRILVTHPEQHFFENEEAMKARYGDPNALVLAGRAVAFCHWSDQPRRPDHEAHLQEINARIRGREATLNSLMKAMASPKDAEEYDQTCNRIEVQKRALLRDEDERRAAAEDVLGPLGMVLWSPDPSEERTLKLHASIPEPPTAAQNNVGAIAGVV